MLAFVFSCATIWTVSGKNPLLPLWSPCVCVLMIRTTGLSVTVRTRSSKTCPHPGSLVSTSVTPSSATNTPVLPPLNASRLSGLDPVITYRLSLTCSMAAASTAT